MELAGSPSHSCWRDGYNSPTQAGWLQSTLEDMDKKIKTMLKLVEEDADSFAKRAEMYYTKRPELVRLIKEFNRAYRSLAERYDRLKGEFGQTIPKAGQVQYGLSCESPRGSPFGKQNPCLHKKEILGFEKLFARLGSCDSDPFEDPEPGVITEGGRMENDQISDQASDDQSAVTSDSEEDNNPCLEIDILQMELHKLQGEKRRLADRCKFVLAENKDVCRRLGQIQVTVAKLQEGNDKLFEQLQAKILQLNDREDEVIQLKKETDCLKGENLAFALQKSQLQRELNASEAEHMKLRQENINLAKELSAASEQNNVLSAALGFHKGQAASLAKTNMESRNDNCEDHQQMETYFQTLPAKETEISALQDENRSLENGLEAQRNTEEQRISQLNLKIEELHHKISGAVEKNLQQHIALLALSEEKREAIRQLCFAMDTLRDKNQRLKEALKYSRGCRHTSLCPALGRDPNLAL